MILWGRKDGGLESKVYAWGIELKWLGSILLLKFEKGSREAYHNHAFNSISWVLKGSLWEITPPAKYASDHNWYYPSIFPVKTLRTTNHMVKGMAPSNWVLTFRGPWSKTWTEYRIKEDREVTLTHGRKEV